MMQSYVLTSSRHCEMVGTRHCRRQAAADTRQQQRSTNKPAPAAVCGRHRHRHTTPFHRATSKSTPADALGGTTKTRGSPAGGCGCGSRLVGRHTARGDMTRRQDGDNRAVTVSETQRVGRRDKAGRPGDAVTEMNGLGEAGQRLTPRETFLRCRRTPLGRRRDAETSLRDAGESGRDVRMPSWGY